MNYNEFINTYNGKSFDYDGVAGVQCVDLIKMYLNKVFGLNPGSWGNAKDYYENFNNLPIKNYFTRIANTPDFMPRKGDIAVWGTGLGNKYGHIAIANGNSDTSKFYSFDLNWGSKVVHEVEHNYKGFLGVLRANDQSKIEEVKLPDLQYQVHIQDLGWQDWKNAGEEAGTTGECKQIEAIKLKGNNGLDVSYRVHMQDIGWGDWVKDGEQAGTTGQNRQIEAINIKSNKRLRASEHIRDVGWMPISEGTELHLGTQGKLLRIEAFKIEVV